MICIRRIREHNTSNSHRNLCLIYIITVSHFGHSRSRPLCTSNTFSPVMNTYTLPVRITVIKTDLHGVNLWCHWINGISIFILHNRFRSFCVSAWPDLICHAFTDICNVHCLIQGTCRIAVKDDSGAVCRNLILIKSIFPIYRCHWISRPFRLFRAAPVMYVWGLGFCPATIADINH